MISAAPPSIVTSQDPDGENVAVEIAPQELSEKYVQIKLKKRVKRLLLKPENQKCLDCSAVKPKWATLITVPPLHGHSVVTFDSFKPVHPDTYYIGGFCCLECSGAHRRLGTHIAFVRSVDLDTLKEHEVKALENGGNEVVNQIYEGNLHQVVHMESECSKPTPTSGQKSREAYIKSKYEQKEFMSIKHMVHFRQKMMQNANNHMSPTMSELSEISPMSQQSSSDKQMTSPMQLQIFTSSPRTLAMIEKYMNPLPKKRGFKKLKPFKRFSRKRFVKNSVQNLRRDGVAVNHTLNIMQTRSVEDETSTSPNTAIENDSSSVSSVKSSMSTTIRRNIIRGAKVMTPNFSNMKLSFFKKATCLEKDSRNSLLNPSMCSQDDENRHTPSTPRKFINMKRNKETLGDNHGSKTQKKALDSNKEVYHPSPASSAGSFRVRFSRIMRTPKRTPNSLEGTIVKHKNGVFFPEDLDVVKESKFNDELDANVFDDENKQYEIKAMKQWAKKFDKVFAKLNKGKKKGIKGDYTYKNISLTGSDETAILLSADESGDFETWRSDGNFSTRLSMKT
jgi:hypothetical protein